MTLKELLAAIKAERELGDKADKAKIDDFLDQIEPIASRDYAMIKKLEKKAEGKTTEDVSALEEQIQKLTDDLEASRRESDKATKKITAERDELSKKLSDEASAINGLLIDGGLTSALAGKVKPAHLEAVKGLLSRSFVVESDGTVRKAVAVTKDKDGKEKKIGVDDYLKEWFAGDVGKEFAIDQGGSGGGSGGSGSGGAGPTGKRARYEALNAKKQEELTSNEKLELVVLAGDPANTKPA